MDRDDLFEKLTDDVCYDIMERMEKQLKADCKNAWLGFPEIIDIDSGETNDQTVIRTTAEMLGHASFLPAAAREKLEKEADNIYSECKHEAANTVRYSGQHFKCQESWDDAVADEISNIMDGMDDSEYRAVVMCEAMNNGGSCKLFVTVEMNNGSETLPVFERKIGWNEIEDDSLGQKIFDEVMAAAEEKQEDKPKL